MIHSLLMEGYQGPVSKETFENAEKEIGVKFPPLLYKLIQNHDAGSPIECCFVGVFPDGSVIRDDFNFRSFNEKTIMNIAARYQLGHDYYPKSKDYVGFGETALGNELMFYYGDCGRDNPHPSIWYWVHDWEDTENNVVKMADSLEDFLDQLLPNDIFDDYDPFTFEPMREYALRTLKERENDPEFVPVGERNYATAPDWAKEIHDRAVITTVYYGEGAEDMEPVVEKRRKE